MKCRFCDSKLSHIFVDLGASPVSNDFLSKNDLNLEESYYPLKVWVCRKCFLVQLEEHKKAKDIFDDKYIYFSSYSKSWLKHCEDYSIKMIKKLRLKNKSLIIEIASNDGYLLQYFLKKDIPVLGIEPTANTAEVAGKKGIKTIVEFFGEKFAKKLRKKNISADLLIGNNVLAHVPDLNDFVAGLKIILKNSGVITMEFPHVLKLIKNNQFDTIYQEHFSYFSFLTVIKVFKKHKLEIFDVEELKTHGGSLRIYAKHSEDKSRKISMRVNRLINKEKRYGLDKIETYENFQNKVNDAKYNLLKFLINEKRKGAKIVGYGAAAKGNTLLNYCGIRQDLISFVVDKSEYKQGKFLPGSHIPVVSEKKLNLFKPDFVIILPWNIKDEIVKQISYIKKWGAKFIIPIPRLKII